MFCLLDAAAEDVLVRAFADGRLKGSGEVVEVGVGDLGEGAELELVAEVGVDVIEHPFEAGGRETSAVAFELLGKGGVAFGDVGGEGDGDGLAEERAGRGAVVQVCVERAEETTDLRVVEIGVTREFKFAALCDVGDATLKECGVDTKEDGSAGKLSGDSCRFEDAYREEGRAAGGQPEEAVASGVTPFEERRRAFAKDESVGVEDGLGDFHDARRDIAFEDEAFTDGSGGEG